MHSGETWWRLFNWQGSQAEEERMAAQVVAAEGYEGLDPSHPLGGPDGGRDAHCTKGGRPWIMAVYFSRGERAFKEIEAKLVSDIEAARKHSPVGVVFVTNQDLKLRERKELETRGGNVEVDIFHLERVAHVLDKPAMAAVRKQYLGIEAGRPPMFITAQVVGSARVFEGDDELAEAFVKRFERGLRKTSKAAREAQEAEETARRVSDPWGIGRMTAPIIAESLPTANMDLLRRFGLMPDESSPAQPLAEEQLREQVAAYRDELASRWPECMDYLAAAAWPGLKFRLQNEERGFLTNVEVVLTFHGCRGVDECPVEFFEWQKVENPDWEPYSAVQLAMMGIAGSPAPASAPVDYPVDYDHDEDGNLRVTIALRELRPRKLWVGEEDDVVLVLRDVDLDAVTVTYTATAYEHDDVYEGVPLSIPVEKMVALDCFLAACEVANEERD